MVNRMRFLALLWMLICLGGMTALWVKFVPQSDLQVYGWWAAETFLGFLAFKAFAVIVMAGGMKKKFREFDRDFAKF